MTSISRRTALGGGAALAGMWSASAGACGDRRRPPSGPTPRARRQPTCRRSAIALRGRGGQAVRRRLGQGGDGRPVPRVGDARWRADAARPGRASASCTGTPMPRNGPTSSMAAAASPPSTPTTVPRPSTSALATSGTSPAAMAIRSRASATSPACFLLVFDNGYFSEFGTFSISDWVGHAPADVLAEELRRSGDDASPTSRRRRSTSRRDRCRRPLPADPAPGSFARRAPSPTATASTRSSRMSSPAAR